MSVPDVTPDLPPPAWRAMLGLLGRLPQGALSRGFGRVSDILLPTRLRRPVLGSFARVMGIDVAEAELPIVAYPTLNHFFVRRLRPGVRAWPSEPNVAASPVDGVLGQCGILDGGRLVQAKGRWYDAASLLDDAEEAGRYRDGLFVTLYLSPRHYHRIHTPTHGAVSKARHIPGALLPVNGPAVLHVADLFPRNERLVAYVDGPLGRIAVVAVGAYNVGRISTAFDEAWNAPPGEGGWVTNRLGARPHTRHYDPPVPLDTGKEIMAFHLGSTVVLLFEPGAGALVEGIQPGREVRLGEPLVR
ncbi:MAG TPA: archaetidylserine decarboxylase [Longimicrobiales bacterium]|nr:archaetidylserine decarboxylase [Longimicrobiales bacterium]